MPDRLSFQVNKQDRQIDCEPGTSLLSLLRDTGYKGVHRVCESGDCGSCTVWLDGKPIHSCLCPAMRVDGRQVTTIEGLENGRLSPMQQAFLAKQGFQCGYCTPGMIMTASKLKCESEAELKAELEGNLCRCTGYEAIVDSVLECGKDNSIATITAKEGQIGKDVPKQDGTNLVTGKPVYTADWSPSGLLHLKVLRFALPPCAYWRY